MSEGLAPQILTMKATQHLAKDLKHDLVNHANVTDEDFDLVFSPEVRAFSEVHWTPIVIATRAAELFQELKIKSVLDIGSGCGKFCILTAILSDAKVTGVEQREFLTQAAKKARNAFQLENLNFIGGSAFDLSWKEFDCIYFFNPFCEQKTPERRIRMDVPMNTTLFNSFTQMTFARLKEHKVGSYVMTYHGFGGTLPDEHALHYQKAIGSDFLKVYKKKKVSDNFVMTSAL